MRVLMVTIKETDYGFPLQCVREVIAFPSITPMHGSLKFCLGVMNLRDHVIPIFDLRIRLGLIPTLTPNTAVVVCKHENVQVGIVVDGIQTVVDVPEENFMKIETNLEGTQEQLIKSLFQIDNKLVLVLDLEKFIHANNKHIEQGSQPI